ncbi:ATP-binding protein [Deinococcus metallilatus]|uniref:histidine kinase n=1 Tax=Deinococcus metallilatus TaxID=1211322 RepID=A0ABR6MVP9_9DEIO|nr:ATP-binding protein [Deinococcus metallilatus]MBB5295764.1 signal transduction histidine kinase/DNA-binding response OmpR family regulator [Deinococcus metallilatus]GMA14293.1 hypothetical protein GCM10025871_06240 [Deinococcus metallilatus]
MARRMRAHDWSRTPLGPPETWPQSLKTTVRTMLTSRFAMWMLWGDDFTFFCNDAYLPTLGIKGDWALGKSSNQVWAEIWKDIWPLIEHVLTTGQATWNEGMQLFLERSGYTEETYHTFSYSPLADDDGRVIGMLCVVAEESERVIGERRLRVLRDLAARTSDVRSTEGVFGGVEACLAADAHDLPFALTYLLGEAEQSAHLASAAGFGDVRPGVKLDAALPGDRGTLAELLRTTAPVLLDDLSPLGELPSGPWDRPPSQALVLPIAQQGQARAAGVLIAGLNPYRPLDDSYRGFLDLFVGQIAASLASANAYEEARERAEALAELDRAKTTFFSNVSHEFRTPLTLMLGPLEELLAHPQDLSERQRGELEVTHRNALRLLKLVNTMLDFTRIEAGRAEATYTPTDLAALTADLASGFRSLAEGAGLRLTVDCPPLPEPVYVDGGLWEKVVLNLLSNAFKFTFEGEIEVRLREEAGQVRLSVRDTGTGIPAHELPRMFERFHRIEGARGRSFEGTGIGLALVRELVSLHGGEITAESTLGQGTTFTVTLPLGHAHLPAERVVHRAGAGSQRVPVPFLEEAAQWLVPAPAPEVEAGAAPTPPASGAPRPRVLLADDNADLREYVTRLLGDQYDVRAVTDGQQALEAARAQAPDLVLSDVMMPHLDGFGLLRALREDPATRDIPVILLSARAGEEARLGGLEAGADDYLAKPFSARELRTRVRTHLELSGLRLEAARQARERGEELGREVAARTAELEQRTAALDAFARFTETAGDTTDPAELARHALNVLRVMLPGLHGTYFELDGAMWKGRVWSGNLREDVVTLVRAGIPQDTPSFARPMQERQAVFVNGWEAAVEGLEATEGYGAGAFYPFFTRGKPHSLLTLGTVQARRWTGREQDIIRAVGRSLDLAFERTEQTARVAAQNEALAARTQALERSNAELEQFAYVASHDLQEPLRSVTSFSQLLVSRYASEQDPRAQQYVRYISEGTERMARLIQDLLAFSRVATHQEAFQPTPTAQVVEQVLQDLRSQIRETGTQVTLGELPTVVGDSTQLRQLFQNLIGNAIKFRAPDRVPEVQVGAVREGECWRFDVRDNGVGIAPEFFERIFVIFQRLHTRDQYEGNGIGLAIAKKIVERHGGQITLTSREGGGTTFSFTLPALPGGGPA